MKRKMVVALALLLQFSSLAAAPPAMADAGRNIPVEIEPTGYVTIARGEAVREGERWRISGVLARPGEVHIVGHVDLAILGPDGALLERRTIPVPGLASHRGGKMEFRFGATLDRAIPAGARAVLRYHAPGGPPGDC